MAAIPFENLDVLLHRPVRLDLEGLQEKLVQARRGGYCFEHATLFAAVLELLGFQPVRHVARPTVLAPRTAAPRTHMLLTVPLAEGVFVVDPGFGALAPRVPVPLVHGATVSAHGETHGMVRDGDWWVLRVQAGGKTVDAWATMLDHDNPTDFEVGNHFTATHPGSPFRNRIMMRALTADGRVTVMNATSRSGARASRIRHRSPTGRRCVRCCAIHSGSTFRSRGAEGADDPGMGVRAAGNVFLAPCGRGRGPPKMGR